MSFGAHRNNGRFRRLSWAWGIGGLLATVVAVAFQGLDFSPERLALLGVLAALATIFSQFEVSWNIAGNRIELSPHSEPLVLAALLLPPAHAMLVALAGVAWSLRGIGRLSAVTNAANAALGYGLASLLVHTLFANPAAGLALLPAALLAAALSELVAAVGSAIALESTRPGSGMSYLRSVPGGAYVDVWVPAFAAVVAAPFITASLFPGALLLAALQVGSYLGFRLLAREQTQSERSTRLHDTFARFVPASVVDDMVASYRHVELGGEHREISVLFCDVRSFTSWSEQQPPATIILELNALLTALSQAVLDTGGTLDKFTGDGLMAFWGAPADQPDHAALAAEAAIMMFERAAAHNQLREFRGQIPLHIGVGCHSGPAIVGNVGHRDRLDYTAIGDTVNLAARLEATTKEAGVPLLISRATFDLLPAARAEAWQSAGAFQVKGRVEQVETFTPREALRQSA